VIPQYAGLREDGAIDWYSFLARPRLPSPAANALQSLHHASIFVTGAGGSIGRALSLRLAALEPRELVLLDASEQALFRLQSELKEGGLKTMPTLLLGSASNAAEIEEAFASHQPSMVFHAAAYKHVALLEGQPLAAIENNALGTHTLIEAAHRHRVARVVLLSTDKAVEPASILGATKRIAEEVTLNRNGVVVRLANVLGTEGSVVDVFLHQIVAGQTITIRHRDSERYFLTLEEAVDLLLAAAVDAAPGALLIPRLDRAHSILALADFLVSHCSDVRPAILPSILFDSLCPGEKVSEALLSTDEARGWDIEADAGGAFLSLASPDTRASLSMEIVRLRDAVDERDLATALKIVQSMVPSYIPSSIVRSLAEKRSARALYS
jgi:FlaA1/EpsC-like NDP-sugar epimerase